MLQREQCRISREKTLSDVPMSNKIGHGGTKPDNRWKIEASKSYTIAPPYNKVLIW